MQLVIDLHGTVRCLYTEVIELASLGRQVIRRGSHVEPGQSRQPRASRAPAPRPQSRQQRA